MTAAASGASHEKCGAKKRAGGNCTRPAGWGTDHVGIGACKLHGGCMPNHRRHAQVEVARRACVKLGIPLEGVGPEDALMAELAECLGNVAFYRERVQNLSPDPSPDEFVLGADGKGHWKHGEPGVWGRTYHVTDLPTGEARAHIWLQLYNEERTRLRHVSVEMVKLGIEHRQLQLAEEDAAAIYGAQVRTLERLGLLDRLQEFRAVFADELEAESQRALPAAT